MAALGNWWQSIKDWFANTFSFGEVLSNALQTAINLIPAPLRKIGETIMGFFPQSPAKEGPLTRLDAVGEGLVGEVAGGIERTSMAELESALDDLPLPSARRAVGTDYAAPVAAGSAAGMPYAPAITVNVQVDARGTTAEDAESIGQMTADKIRDILDQWVRESFRSVVMQEV